ncbi:type II toxin-antitoxin system prevent-host-death family antitoxin [Actimicrobium sp. CCI2.3]|uniref:type II toxin-antitoxin system prevent-host-death family antitoxin n=1 Tax=Actimicrobium sp. CCI2.3 TaxID=3048616 RepID=UPI002AB3F30F|nr:type II toxin-antitoxin system prevent-host-death family antitoxin [Actimicrobium sp. CCI2.3]MDY7574771.1 type II toxin-antitoxin system prevent-host-death family antitoxin [Actimicrobium sp. CCI2.3]MEB0020268.1 type II toxin-antitoxin system prevent-host-death family antitoxin [Actimicrobium sp. CCI2.3]
MDAVNYTFTRQNLTAIMDRVGQDHAPLMITRQKGAPVVMMSLDDYNALQETAYLLRSPKNAQRLSLAVESLRNQGGTVRNLADED